MEEMRCGYNSAKEKYKSHTEKLGKIQEERTWVELREDKKRLKEIIE